VRARRVLQEHALRSGGRSVGKRLRLRLFFFFPEKTLE